MAYERNRYLRERIVSAGAADASNLSDWEILGLAEGDEAADLEEAAEQFEADWQEVEETMPARAALRDVAFAVRDRAVAALAARRQPAVLPMPVAPVVVVPAPPATPPKAKAPPVQIRAPIPAAQELPPSDGRAVKAATAKSTEKPKASANNDGAASRSAPTATGHDKVVASADAIQALFARDQAVRTSRPIRFEMGSKLFDGVLLRLAETKLRIQSQVVPELYAKVVVVLPPPDGQKDRVPLQCVVARTRPPKEDGADGEFDAQINPSNSPLTMAGLRALLLEFEHNAPAGDSRPAASPVPATRLIDEAQLTSDLQSWIHQCRQSGREYPILQEFLRQAGHDIVVSLAPEGPYRLLRLPGQDFPMAVVNYPLGGISAGTVHYSALFEDLRPVGERNGPADMEAFAVVNAPWGEWVPSQIVKGRLVSLGSLQPRTKSQPDSELVADSPTRKHTEKPNPSKPKPAALPTAANMEDDDFETRDWKAKTSGLTYNFHGMAPLVAWATGKSGQPISVSTDGKIWKDFAGLQRAVKGGLALQIAYDLADEVASGAADATRMDVAIIPERPPAALPPRPSPAPQPAPAPQSTVVRPQEPAKVVFSPRARHLEQTPVNAPANQPGQIPWAIIGIVVAIVGTVFAIGGALSGRSSPAAASVAAPSSPYRIDGGAGTVLDTRTQLTWQLKTDGKDYSWEQAKEHCRTLTTGETRWRLPEQAELEKLAERGKQATFDEVAFPDNSSGFFWTATLVSGMSAQLVRFSGSDPGDVGSLADGYRVRCVLGNSAASAEKPAVAAVPASPYRLDESAGTVLDTRTQLTWQRKVGGDEYNWQQGQTYCKSLALAGGAWRVPTKEELEGLVHKGKSPTIDERAFPDTPGEWFWTSTPFHGSPPRAWVVVFSTGNSFDFGQKTTKSHVRCVRAAPTADAASPAFKPKPAAKRKNAATPSKGLHVLD